MLNLGTSDVSRLFLGEREIKKAYLGGAVVLEEKNASRLPEGYTELEYIQSTGTQYIDSGKKLTSSTKLIMDVAHNAVLTSSYKYFWGVTYSSSTTTYTYSVRLVTASIQIATSVVGKGTVATFKKISSDVTPRRMVIITDLKNKTASIEGEPEIALTTNSVTSQMPTVTLLAGQGGTKPIDAKLYSVRMEDSGNLVADFVPCKNPSGEVGLYDVVGKAFCANTGTFTAGPTV